MNKRIRRAPENDLVRPSRDGDQFHYLWAARRCLMLLSFDTTAPIAISIEGSSPHESTNRRVRPIADEIIDVAEYYGSENLQNAVCANYIQLKHSTLHAGKAWTLAESKKTIQKFSQRYKDLRANVWPINPSLKVEFSLVSNRPIDQKLFETIDDVANDAVPRHKRTHASLSVLTALDEQQLIQFCKILRLKGDQPGLWDQRNILESDASHYLPGSDHESVIQLKELVTRKALSENKENPVITRIDVLRSLKTDETRLFPAPCLIDPSLYSVAREQEVELLAKIRDSEGPVILHADGGIGKSVFATRIRSTMPAGSVCVLFDCFGNGLYRSASRYRHRHKDAFVQIANELASKGLCHPMIPSSHADASDYMRAFLSRLKQSISSLRSRTSDALLYVVIDAADNAQMAAQELGETRAFVSDLLREQVPDGIRLVALCRTHRRNLLNAPSGTLQLELQPFSKTETECHLKNRHSGASEHDVEEFHHLTSQNPRVQAFALSRYTHLSEVLRSLGPNPTSVDDTFALILEKAVSNALDAVNDIEKRQIDGICKAIATLRPLIPIAVVSSLAGVQESLVKSFALDIGRPIVIAGDTLQFFDEPSETWFREKFRPTNANLLSYIQQLGPLASSSAYAASMLPQLLLEAGEYDELVALALSSNALPVASPLEKRDIDLQRLHFAIKACLRTGRYKDAAKLSLKAGGESAGDQRQRQLLESNTDLAGIFLDGERLQELASRRVFSSWNGSHHAYEASLLSAKSELNGEARSRLRMAEDWLSNWARLPEVERRDDPWNIDDILELAYAHLNIHGPQRCAQELRRWKSPGVSFNVGRMLACKLIDSNRYDDLNQLAYFAGKNIYLILAIILEFSLINRLPNEDIISNSLKLILDPKCKKAFGVHWETEELWLHSVSAWLEASLLLKITDHETLITIVNMYLPDEPPLGISSRYSNSRVIYLRLYALKASLSKKRLELTDLAHKKLREKMNKNSHGATNDVREFKERVGVILPWYRLWADLLIQNCDEQLVSAGIAKAMADTAHSTQYSNSDDTGNADEVARIWLAILANSNLINSRLLEDFSDWISHLSKPLPAFTYTYLARVLASYAVLPQALNFIQRASAIITELREDAHSMVAGHVKISRAILSLSKSEANAYFDLAAEVANKIGDENLHRWGALLDLAHRSSDGAISEPKIAFNFSRCAELTRFYVERDKHFDWKSTVKALAGLCPESVLPILSRWRDRGFGSTGRLLPVALNELLKRKLVDPKYVLSFYSIRAEWDVGVLLGSVLESCDSASQMEEYVDYFMKYFMLIDKDQEECKAIMFLLTKYGLKETKYYKHLDYHSRRNPLGKEGYEGDTFKEAGITKSQCGDIFGDIDILTSDGIYDAYEKYKRFGVPYDLKIFLSHACSQVPIGREAEFIEKYIEVRGFELFHYRYLLENIPDHWSGMLSVKSSLAVTLKSMARRFCSQITKNEYCELLPLKLATSRTGISEKELIEEVLKSQGASPGYLETDRFFSIVGMLAVMMTPGEALESLSYGLGLLDCVLEDADGDGPWTEEFRVNETPEDSMAGFVWCALASPNSATRWEAAHIVRAQLMLGHNKMLGSIFSFGLGRPITAYYDNRLCFYKMHALQWFLLGLSRGVQENPGVIKPYVNYLLNWLEEYKSHVYICELLKRILLCVNESTDVTIEPSKLAVVRSINATPFSEIVRSDYDRELKNSTVLSETVMTEDEEVFHVTYGMDKVCDHLGRCFGVTGDVIEKEISQIVRQEWGVVGNNKWDDDLRHKMQLFRNYDTNYADYPSPNLDDHRSYLSYHALMFVAGRLLEKLQTYRHPEELQNSFQDWMSDYDLTREDRRWLSDRRDPVPLEYPKWKMIEKPEIWRWSLSKADFDKVLIPYAGVIQLWGDWKWIVANMIESVHVRSALVSRAHSSALMRALQVANNPHDYRIPDAEDDLQVDRHGFSLEGWLVDRIHDNKLDRRDPWAGDIRYPAIEPSEKTIGTLSLKADAEMRCWSVEHCHSAVAWSEVWGRMLEERAEYDNRNYGRRFKATNDFVRQLLLQYEKHMIIEVEISRSVHQARWENRKDEELEYLPPSARLFIIEQSGRITSL